MTHEYDTCTQAGPHAEIGSTGRPSSDGPSNLLVRVSMALTGPLDERLRMARLAHCLVPALGDCCLVELIDRQGQVQLAACVAETPERAAELRARWERQRASPDAWAPSQAALREQALIPFDNGPPSSPTPPADLHRVAAFYKLLGFRSALVTPIIVQGKTTGAITLAANRPGRFGERSRSCMAEVGRRAAIAIENARLYGDERAARAEAEAAMRARDELTALIAHDLRNPLAIVHGQTNLLLRQLQQPELDRDRLSRGLNAVSGAAAQMRLLLDDLQDIANLRAGQPLQLEREPVDLLALVRRAVALQQAATARHTLRVEAALPELPCLCDARRLERVVANLLGNAIRYSPAGGPVTVTVGRAVDPQGPWATLSIADQGVGIPRKDLPHIFAPFYRARNVAEAIRGTGLGLASADAIITQHGGAITVTSTEGVGSTFTIRLPLPKDDSAPGC